MMKGRKAKPKAQSDLEGNPGRRPKQELVDFPEGTLRPTPFLDKAAMEAWERIVPELEAVEGLVKPLDADILSVYCSLRSMYETAQEEVRTGMFYRSSTGVMKVNPAVRVAIDLSKVLTSIMKEYFGTPASRTSGMPAKVDPNAATDDFTGFAAGDLSAEESVEDRVAKVISL